MTTAERNATSAAFTCALTDQVDQLIRASILGGENDFQACSRAVNFVQRLCRLPPAHEADCWRVFLELAAHVRSGGVREMPERASA